MSARILRFCCVLVVCALGYKAPACASTSASAGVGGYNPSGVFHPGDTIYVQEMANGSTSVEVNNGSGITYYTRQVNYTDSLMGSDGHQYYGEGSIEEDARAAVALDGWSGRGAYRNLTQEDIGLQSGWRWGSVRAYANDGSSVADAQFTNDVPYTYEVQGWFMPMPGTDVPDVLAPEEAPQ